MRGAGNWCWSERPRGMRHRALLALVAAAISGAGCERTAPGAHAAAESAGAPSDSLAAPGTPALRSVDTTTRVPAPVREACADLHAVFSAVARSRGSANAVAGPRDTTTIFGGLDTGPAERACYVSWTDSASDVAPDAFLSLATARGWKERSLLFSADGPDGTLLAISRGGAACVFEMRWDGGDDSDSTYVPTPGFTAIASCFTDRPDRY